MRIVKLLVISVVFLFLLVTLISVFIPSHVRVSKAINVDAGLPEVYGMIAHTGNWKEWYPPMQDSTIKFSVEADSNTVMLNDTRVMITGREKNAITGEMISAGGTRVKTGWNILYVAQQDSVTVQWFMDFKMKWYPWEKFSSLLFEKRYGPVMEQGLSNLKSLVENSDRR